jgi:hypothetical protein
VSLRGALHLADVTGWSQGWWSELRPVTREPDAADDAAIGAFKMSGCGPTLPTLAATQVGSYLGFAGRDANVVAKEVLDPLRKRVLHCNCTELSTNQRRQCMINAHYHTLSRAQK